MTATNNPEYIAKIAAAGYIVTGPYDIGRGWVEYVVEVKPRGRKATPTAAIVSAIINPDNLPANYRLVDGLQTVGIII